MASIHDSSEPKAADPSLQARAGSRTPTPPPPYTSPVTSEFMDLGVPQVGTRRVGTTFYSQPTTLPWSDQDPRDSSTESLVPRPITSEKRTLMLIYIHGFMGNETSFRSFPAHVHNEVTQLLAGTHVVHTKVYPRYRSRNNIEVVRNDFSKWLAPHESAQTDVILLGHSMGGLLSAEVALMPPPSPNDPNIFLHRILGTVNFDTPFLGMHPAVVKDGLSSLFRAADEPTPVGRTDSSASRTPSQATSHATRSDSSSSSSYFSQKVAPVNDPNYNPPFPNDVRLPVRKTWENALHFLTKHSDNLTKAATTYVKSHIEFGSAMADYKALKARYHRIRALEDIDDMNLASMNAFRPPKRIRFINFYTASTGRTEKPKTPLVDQGGLDGHESESNDALVAAMRDLDAFRRSSDDHSPTERSTVDNEPLEETALEGTDIDGHRDMRGGPSGTSAKTTALNMAFLDPAPYAEDEETALSPNPAPIQIPETSPTDLKKPESFDELEDRPELASSVTTLSLPPIPEQPTMPAPFNPDSYADKDARKVAEKDYQRRMKTYSQAVKDREKLIKDRQKIVEKREKKLRKEHDKAMKGDKNSHEKQEKERLKAESKRMKAEAARLRGESAGGESELPSAEMSQTHSQEVVSPLAQHRSTDTDVSGSGEHYDATACTYDGSRDKPKKDKKFCMLPPKAADGTRDPTWIRIFMQDVDVVAAHCGLFFYEKPHYNKLVTDVGQTILQWVERAEEVQQQRMMALEGVVA